jgi:uncharacterized repeat protein (TIGR02543 family)
MKAMFSLKRHGYLKMISVFLIAVILIAGVVGCEGEGEEEFELTLVVNPAATGTATDETGTSPYTAGTVVDIKAVAADCYQFDAWTAPSGTLGDAFNATTTFTMPASDVTVTANFAAVPADHFKFYQVGEGGPYVGEVVQLEDQFDAWDATVEYAFSFGNAAEKDHPGMPLAPMADPTRHYTLYDLELVGVPQSFEVMINNQFQDDVWLTVHGPVALAVPTQKEDHEMPVCLDHLLLYEVMGEPFTPVPGVNLKDQFIPEGDDVTVYEPVLFANPVKKTFGSDVTEIETDEHMVFYYIEGEPFDPLTVQIQNQFHATPAGLDLLYPELLGVPSQKIEWEQPVNHFKTYWADWPLEPPPPWEPPLPVDVQLEDQFVTINATVWAPYLFANPTVKGHGEDWTPIWDPNDHLTFYYIEPWADPQVWEVSVDNQFGPDQVLTIAGPFYLAVPTGKLALEWPADLNHFLIYDVIDHGEYLPEDVYIQDQFFVEGAWTNVYDPWFFAVPAHKIHPPGSAPTPIVDDMHLVFYGLGGIEPWNTDNLPVINQFGDQYLYVWEDEGNYLGVPSVKTAVLGGPWPYI